MGGGGMQIIGYPGHWWVFGLSCELGAPGGSERKAMICLLFDWLPLVTWRTDGRAEIAAWWEIVAQERPCWHGEKRSDPGHI